MSSVRIIGIDPGLTRCGVGVIDMAANRHATLVDVRVIRSNTELALAERLLLIANGIREVIELFSPQILAVERVFAQKNLESVMGTAQASGVALLVGSEAGLTTALHTPTEVKAAITGYGQADKAQVQQMVARVLGLAVIPKPADAADALALAICHGWRGQTMRVQSDDVGLTPAQAAWRQAINASSTKNFKSR